MAVTMRGPQKRAALRLLASAAGRALRHFLLAISTERFCDDRSARDHILGLWDTVDAYGDRSHIDFSRPVGEAALLSPESVSWRVFKNPLSLFIGGVTAVIMELAEPRVRTGVWEHTTFRLDPIRRLRRTGLAAMVTIYGARSTAEPMIARIRRMHEMVAGTTASGE
jgi:uncharacterized protein (DUF2236 family)